MKYQALYRKYRPSSFDSITGQSTTIKILQNSIINNKVGHAYLFYGPRGTGKTSTAKIFARSVNCLKPVNGIQCEKCDGCLKSIEKECIDIIEIDAASNNGVDEIRDLKTKVSFVPAELKYKVYIIDEVHMLSTGAFNALLKTLEEPPEYVIFILATTELNKVPSTIISRCQLMEFKKLTENQIADRLKYISKNENIKIDDDAIIEISKYSNGGLRDAIGLLEKIISYKSTKITIDDVREIMGNVSIQEINDFITLIKNKDISSIITKINDYYDEGIDLSKMVYSIIDTLTNQMISEKKYDTYICSIIKELDLILNDMNKSDNPKLILEISLLNIVSDKQETVTATVQKEEPKITIKEEIKVVDTVENKPEEKKEPEIDIINIRVCNTLAKANKEIISNIRKNWKNISDLAFDTEFGNLARTLESDIIPVAASDEYVVLNSKLRGLSDQINTSRNDVEKIFKKIFDNDYKVICITESDWKNYIEEYKKDKTKFVYQEEPKEKETKKRTLKDKAKELFED